jgi:hypothetical protein
MYRFYKQSNRSLYKIFTVKENTSKGDSREIEFFRIRTYPVL